MFVCCVFRDYRISQHIGGETGFLSLITVSRAARFGIFTGINKDPDQVSTEPGPGKPWHQQGPGPGRF